MFRQLAFASTASAGLRAADTSALISALRESHASAGITGVLLYSGHSFLQLIEGSDPAISASWRALLADGRQRNPVVLHDATTLSRWFPDWRAGYLAESSLTPFLARWKGFAPKLPPPEIDQLRMLLAATEAF